MAKKVSIKNVKIAATAAKTENEQLKFDEVESTPVTAKAVKKVIPVKSESTSTGKKTPKIKVTKTGPALVIPTKKYEPSETVLNTLELAKEMGADLNSPLYQLPKRTKDFDVEQLGLEVKSFSEMKVLIKAFYNSFQPERIAAENQQRSLEQGASEGELADIDTDMLDDDDAQLLHYPTYAYIVEMKQEAEKQLQKLIESYVVSTKIGQYLTSIVGIGPLLAGSLMAYIDINKAKYAGQVWSYAGLNDNNDPWLSEEKVKKVMDKVVGSAKEITDDMIVQIAILTGRSAKRIKKGATKIDEDGNETITPASLRAYLKKPPYNRNFKTVCWKMGQSVLKHKNSEKSVYGKLLNERLLYEKQKNADHGYILEALKNMGYIDKKPDISKEEQEALLEQMHQDIKSGAFVPKLGKTTQIYKTYYDGYLGDAHINARARRWVVKLMLSHIFEAMYIDANGTFPPAPYIVSVGGHADYIYPEVKYSDFWNISEEEIAKRAVELHQDKGFKFKI